MLATLAKNRALAPSVFGLSLSVVARVVMYKTPYCAYCLRAAALLDAKGVVYDEVDVSTDRALRAEIMATSGRRTVPQIFIDGHAIGGFQELAALERSGTLDSMLA